MWYRCTNSCTAGFGLSAKKPSTNVAPSTVRSAVRAKSCEFQPLVPPRGSVAAHVQAAVPGCRVVAAFHHLPATELGHLGQPIDSDVDLISTIGTRHPGERVVLKIERDSRLQDVKVTLTERPGDDAPTPVTLTTFDQASGRRDVLDLQLAELGAVQAVKKSKPLAKAANVLAGKITCKGVAEAFGMSLEPAEELAARL